MQQAAPSQHRPTEQLENGTGAVNGHSVPATVEEDDDGYPRARALTSFDHDIIRLIGQYLKFLGFRRTADHLVTESRCQFEHPAATKLRSNILRGDFEKALGDLNELRLLVDTPDTFQKMKYLVLEQKYFELLEAGRNLEALQCLRREVSPLLFNQPGANGDGVACCSAAAATGKVRELSLALMLPTVDEVRLLAGWITMDQMGKSNAFELIAVRNKLLEKISTYLPRHVMVSEQRLQVLLRQAVEWQCDQCTLHNSDLAIESSSLLSDHSCNREQFPACSVQVLQEHCDEVWFVRFSPDGSKLASGAKDGTVNVWDVDTVTHRVAFRRAIDLRALQSHDPPPAVHFLAWSPNSQLLLVCGPEENSEVWIYDAVSGERKHKVTQANDDQLTCAAWFPDSKRFVCGGQRGQFYLIDLNGTLIDQWEGVRVVHLACAPDNKTVVAADNLMRLRAYVFNGTDSREYTLFTEDYPIVSFVLDDSGRYALVHVQQQGMHLWDLQNRTLVRRFRGVLQQTYALHGTWAPPDSIGGHHQQFVASGSEDGRIAVFNVKRDEAVLFLEGHTRSVSCVHWNPRLPSMLASASDDGTVRIWAPERFSSRKHSLTATSSEQQGDSDDELSVSSKHATTQL